MFEILTRLFLFLTAMIILFGGICYTPFAYLLNAINRNLHLKIGTLFYKGFLLTINKLTERTFEMEGENIIDPNTNYLIISNHVNYYDFTVISNLFNKSNLLGSLKFVIKSEMRSILGVFQILDLLNFLTIERNYQKDEKTIKKYCEDTIKYNQPLNMIIFPEGTIITEDTMAKSVKFRVSKNLKPHDFVLSTKYKGSELLIKAFKDSHIKNILDLTFVYPKCEQPNIWEMLFTNKKYKIKYKMNVTPIENVKDVKLFIDEAWEKKEEWIGRMVNYNKQWYVNKKERMLFNRLQEMVM